MTSIHPPLPQPADDSPLDSLRHLPVIAYVDEIDERGVTTMRFVSGQHEAITGFTLTDFQKGGWYWDARIHPDDLPAYRQVYERMWRDQAPLEATYRFLRRDGEWIWLEDRSTAAFDAVQGVTVVSGVVFDVTAQRRVEDEASHAQLALRVSEREACERFDRLFHASPAPTAVTSLDEANTFVEVNDAFLRLLGFTRDEVIGSTAEDLDLFEDLEGQQELARRLRAEGSFTDARLRVRAKDGRTVDGVFSGELIRFRGGAYFLTVMADDTERRSAEEALLELNAHLEQRIAARTRQLEAANRELRSFVDCMAHDLRGPLRTIGSFGQILEAEHHEQLDDEGRDAVRRIVRANGRMERLIEALLDLSGLVHNPLRVETLDLSVIAGEVLADLQAADPDRRVEVTIPDGMHARLDPKLALILLESLLGNAWKFSSRRDLAHIGMGSSESGPERVFWVRDDGAGFDQRYVGRLFKPFERLHADAEFAGAGTGLATVQRIVERHGGRTWAEGETGEGASFYFALPTPPTPAA
jgi:PAS domain S-box-containing protein